MSKHSHADSLQSGSSEAPIAEQKTQLAVTSKLVKSLRYIPARKTEGDHRNDASNGQPSFLIESHGWKAEAVRFAVRPHTR